MKYCTGCKQDRPFTAYSKSSRSKDGLQYYCKPCSRERTKTSLAKRDQADLAASKRAWYEKNRETQIARAKRYHEEHREWSLCWGVESNRRWRQKYPEKAKDLQNRTIKASKLKKYNLTEQRFNEMLENQRFCCAVCGDAFTDDKLPRIDHDHNCCPGEKSCGNCVRGLLCNNCNVAIGMIRDNPDRARKLAKYLESSLLNYGSEVQLNDSSSSRAEDSNLKIH